jgi:AraC-like DNA-binding protein
MNRIAPKILRISTDDLPESNRLEALCDIYGRTILRHEIEPTGDRPFEFHASLYSMPGLGLSAAVISQCVAPRGPQHIDGDDLVLNVSLSGGRTVRQRGREITLRAGEAVLTTSADPGVVTIPTTSRLVSLRVPRDVLKPTIVDLDASLLRPIPPDTPALRLLTSYVGAIKDLDALTTPELQALTVAHIHDLVSLTIGATREAAEIAQGRGVRAARLRAIKAGIMASLRSDTLSIAAIAARHGISPRYVHMLFESEGTTFSEFVLGHRLAFAHRMLRDPRCLAHSITAIAFECGFVDLSHFSRAFRGQYGATPSDIREAALRGE